MMTTVATVMVTTPRLYFFETSTRGASEKTRHNGNTLRPGAKRVVCCGVCQQEEGARNDAGQLLRKAT